jgi:CubicO group peptidase (beta-lactamase class C family)
MLFQKKPLSVILAFLLTTVAVYAQSKLPRSNPEAEGVSSDSIIKFIDAAGNSQHEMHSVMVLRHGKVIAEGWWKPYSADLKHTMYSVSKTFTATAIGFAVAEKRLSVNDKVISFFPAQLPDTVSTNLSELTVKDLLSMSVGQQPDPTALAITGESPWVSSFMRMPIVHKPGTKFLYNSLGSYMLSAIVQKVTGERVVDYLRPRLFEPLGIEGMDWEIDPAGINSGGWGLRVKTEDMAKVGQLYLQKGKWNGRQILPAEWIEEATTKKIDQAPEMPQAQRDSSDWTQGYAYQIWRSRNNSYRADGAFGQYILVLPEKDAVIVITSESPNMQDEINIVWKYLLPAFKEKSLPSSKSTAQLKEILSKLTLRAPAKSSSPVEKSISGKTFSIEPNDMKCCGTVHLILRTIPVSPALKQIQPLTKFNWEMANGNPALPTKRDRHL